MVLIIDNAALEAVSDEEAEAGGQALRERQMAGRITRSWDSLPDSEKRKWVHTACVVIAAAKMTARALADTGGQR